MPDTPPPTSTGRSYDPDHLGCSFDDEVARLHAQVELSWPIEQRRLSAIGITDGQRLLELGCGPAFFTSRLASWLPTSSIVALDSDRRMLDLARQTLAGQGLDSRIVLLEASANATALSSHAFDAAISRYLFQHLGDPVAAAVEIRRVLRPGGIHIVIDVDDGLWGLAQPFFSELQATHRRRSEAQRRRGGDRFCGRRLGRILRQAGYARVELDVFSYNSDDTGLGNFCAQMDPDQFLPLIEEGLVTVVEYMRARTLYEQFLRTPGAFVLSVGFIACAENPR